MIYIHQPFVSPDSNLYFHNKSIILGSLLLFQKDYYKTSMVFNFGRPEDIPFGYLAKITFGSIKDQFFEYPYAGLNVNMGKFFKKKGCVSIGAIAGGLIYHGGWQDILMVANIQYISPLVSPGRYKLRQFGRIYYTLSASDSSVYYIKYRKSIPGLNERDIWGKSTMSAYIETALLRHGIFTDSGSHLSKVLLWVSSAKIKMLSNHPTSMQCLPLV